jgi:hypothetical protein
VIGSVLLRQIWCPATSAAGANAYEPTTARQIMELSLPAQGRYSGGTKVTTHLLWRFGSGFVVTFVLPL